jgi:hypothetical protein
MVWTFNLFFVINLALAFFYPLSLTVFLCQFAIKFFSELLYMKPLNSFFKRNDLVYLIPIATVLQVFYIIYIGLAGNSGKYQWKGRMVK